MNVKIILAKFQELTIARSRQKTIVKRVVSIVTFLAIFLPLISYAQAKSFDSTSQSIDLNSAIKSGVYKNGLNLINTYDDVSVYLMIEKGKDNRLIFKNKMRRECRGELKTTGEKCQLCCCTFPCPPIPFHPHQDCPCPPIYYHCFSWDCQIVTSRSAN